MIRRQLTLTGVVQGVGFRPNVVRLAAQFPITGFCGNDDNSVFIEAQGDPESVAAFFTAVRTDLPPLATILIWRESDLAVVPNEPAFTIVASRRAVGAITLLPPDAAICPDCQADMNDPANRRYHYPFTTCTNCGPRLSIIKDVPYDRPLTTMADFPMCDACRAEYEDAHDRRFHAQPISCYDCGPNLWLEPSGAEAPPQHDDDRRTGFAQAIAGAVQMLRDGKILAVKGIGGFTLMCDARNADAVATLRARKRRPGKPLAVMAGSLAAASRIADLGDLPRQLLSGREAPIVLAPMSDGYDLAPQVAPGLDDIGIMLPYTPLHRLLLGRDDVLVATSANSSSRPLTFTNEDARRDLSHIVDAFLMHDRGIHVPVEDSVVMAFGGGAEPIRRSRGYAPLPVFLGGDDRCVLAVGAELKNTFALTRDGMAFMSAHIGDMGSLETQAAFERSVDQMLTAHRRTPRLIVVDKHPGYATHNWGLRQGERLDVPVLEVQHHHAHALSLLAENLTQPLGWFLVLDGTGFGDDGTIWGGELLHLDADNPLSFERAWHLPGFGLPGGDSAIRHPWKSAAGLAFEYGLDIADRVAPRPAAAGVDEWALVQSQLRSGFGVVRTTSTGRLFDAVAAWLGVCQTVTYEAQAAMELEAVARRCPHDHDVDCADVAGLVELLDDGLNRATPTPCLARMFHRALTHLLARAVNSAVVEPSAVGLTGGVFANRLLSSYLARDLEQLGHKVVRHQIVPSNDGGLALGQALAGVVFGEVGQ
ncbi:MAG: carbamoyltransferase HypF [Propionibacteriaceae bacterium]|nr:carbamoyltransferase HypF [Propionibacteriaceae bacterium]